MANIIPFKRPVHWDNLRQDEAERIVRECAESTDNVTFDDHAFDRIEEREIVEADAFRILRTGHVLPDLEQLSRGDWKVVVTKKIKGSREAAVITVILEEGAGLYVRTVMWVD